MIDSRPNTTRNKRHETSPNEVRNNPVGTIPSTGNASKEKQRIDSQKPAPGQPY